MKSAHFKSLKKTSGFTLIELLVVIGILAILLAITLVAINPARQFAQANNTQRSSDVNAILNAISQYAADNNGQLPSGVTGTLQYISNAESDLCSDLVPLYLAALPVDPTSVIGDPVSTCSGAYDTEYRVQQVAANERITVDAPNAELTQVISVTR